MEVRQLRYFVAVAEELHFSRAAARLHVAQPSLSQQIAKLERDVGVPLLYRSTRTVSLTPAGEAFLADARDVLRRLDMSGEHAREAATAGGETFTIGLRLPVVPPAVTVMLSNFRQSLGDVRLRSKEIFDVGPVAALRDKIVDAVLLRDRPENTGLEGETLLTESMVAALPPDHRLAHRDSISMAELEGEAFVQLRSGAQRSGYSDLANRCARYGFAPTVSCETMSIGTIPILVMSGSGVSVLPEGVLGFIRPVVAVRLEGETSTINVAWLPGEEPARVRPLFHAAGTRAPTLNLLDPPAADVA